MEGGNRFAGRARSQHPRQPFVPVVSHAVANHDNSRTTGVGVRAREDGPAKRRWRKRLKYAWLPDGPNLRVFCWAPGAGIALGAAGPRLPGTGAYEARRITAHVCLAEGARGALAPGAVQRGLLGLAHGSAQAFGRVARVGGRAGGGQAVSHLCSRKIEGSARYFGKLKDASGRVRGRGERGKEIRRFFVVCSTSWPRMFARFTSIFTTCTQAASTLIWETFQGKDSRKASVARASRSSVRAGSLHMPPAVRARGPAAASGQRAPRPTRQRAPRAPLTAFYILARGIALPVWLGPAQAVYRA